MFEQYLTLKIDIIHQPSKNSKEKFNILIVDDEKIIRDAEVRLIKQYFKNSDIEYMILQANDGVECITTLYLASLKNIKINFIITDENMRYINGSVCSKIINKMVKSGVIKSLPIFINTALGNGIDSSIFSEQVKNIYSKPIEMKNLKDIFSQI